MATARGNGSVALIDALFERPEAFDFFQAVRLLELSAAGEERRAVGEDLPPEREGIRFRTRPSLAFATAEIQGLERGAEGEGVELQVSFLGFLGTAGVLPQGYTELVLERLQLKDTTLRDFLDLFHHRAISLFYRAWRKYRFPLAYEHALRGGEEDPFTRALFGLVGLGLAALRDRQGVDDADFLYEAGHFARRVRSAPGLQQALSDLFGVPVRVHEFVGQWLEIPPEERCVLPRAHEPGDHRVSLGRGATLGSRVWDVPSKVELELGPLTRSQHDHLRPGGAGHAALCSVTRAYLGLHVDYDLRLVLARGESPGTRLCTSEHGFSRLGLDTWLEHEPSVPVRRMARFPGGQASRHAG